MRCFKAWEGIIAPELTVFERLSKPAQWEWDLSLFEIAGSQKQGFDMGNA